MFVCNDLTFFALQENKAGIAFKLLKINNLKSAEEGTRTPTPLRVHGPEPCASANSATSALCCARPNPALRREILIYSKGFTECVKPGAASTPGAFAGYRPTSLGYQPTRITLAVRSITSTVHSSLVTYHLSSAAIARSG